MCGTSLRSLAAVCLLGLCLPCSAIDPASVPPFDPSRVYQVPGTVLEEFRTGLIELDNKLTTSEKLSVELKETLSTLQTSYDRYKTRTTIALILLGGVAILSTSAAVAIALK